MFRLLKSCSLLIYLVSLGFWAFTEATAEDINVTSKWRRIDVLVDLTVDYALDPSTGEYYSAQKLESEVAVLFGSLNQYFRPLKLVVNPARIVYPTGDGYDPYQKAFDNYSAFELLKTAAERWSLTSASEFDLVVVLARSPLGGQTGLAYPSTSCIVPRYSVVFATQGGQTASHRYVLAQTLAHEIGHFIGMSHDSVQYPQGFSLMWPHYAVYTTGFSTSSVVQALEHSGEGMAGGSCFTELADWEMSVDDQDGDGVSDGKELEAGTSIYDPGSFKEPLESPLYTMWNSFLEMVNILELINPADENLTLAIVLYNLSGGVEYQQNLTIPSRGQFDLIVNDLPGFKKDSYGLLAINFAGRLEGRTSYYRYSATKDSYEFSYSIPLRNPSYGKTSVAFNTFQPSLNPKEAAATVANWLTLVNLAKKTKLFTVSAFDNQGRVIRFENYSVPPLGRIDIDGGHGFAGHSAVGFHEIVPQDPSAPYQAQLVRYGGHLNVVNNQEEYRFAFPLLARAGNGQPTNLFISAADKGEQNWVELINTSSAASLVGLSFISADGSLILGQEVTLAPHQQVHINAAAVLNKAGVEVGLLSIVPNSANSILAQSMFYNRDQRSGSILAMYGLQAEEALDTQVFGSYNLFLEMDNVLKIANIAPSEVKGVITINGPASKDEREVTIPANGQVNLSLRGSGISAARSSSYGLVSIKFPASKSIYAQLLRVRRSGGALDFISPTVLR